MSQPVTADVEFMPPALEWFGVAEFVLCCAVTLLVLKKAIARREWLPAVKYGYLVPLAVAYAFLVTNYPLAMDGSTKFRFYFSVLCCPAWIFPLVNENLHRELYQWDSHQPFAALRWQVWMVNALIIIGILVWLNVLVYPLFEFATQVAVK